MSRANKHALWQQHLQSWSSSGLSQQAYCDQHQLKLATFSYWRKRLKPAEVLGKLMPITASRPQRAAIRITLPQATIEIPLDGFAQSLPMILRTLQVST